MKPFKNISQKLMRIISTNAFMALGFVVSLPMQAVVLVIIVANVLMFVFPGIVDSLPFDFDYGNNSGDNSGTGTEGFNEQGQNATSKDNHTEQGGADVPGEQDSDDLYSNIDKLQTIFNTTEIEELLFKNRPKSAETLAQIEEISHQVASKDEKYGAVLLSVVALFKHRSEVRSEKFGEQVKKAYTTNKSQTDDFARKMLEPILEAKQQGLKTLQSKADYLNEEGYRTRRGNKFDTKGVHNLEKRQRELGLFDTEDNPTPTPK